jgi:hypothetical protein
VVDGVHDISASVVLDPSCLVLIFCDTLSALLLYGHGRGLACVSLGLSDHLRVACRKQHSVKQLLLEDKYAATDSDGRNLSLLNESANG